MCMGVWEVISPGGERGGLGRVMLGLGNFMYLESEPFFFFVFFE